MKWDCGPTWLEKREMEREWHSWFAWRPVQVSSHDCRWLEWVDRRNILSKYMTYRTKIWEYRGKDTQ